MEKKAIDCNIINLIQICTEAAKLGLHLKLRLAFVKQIFFLFLYYSIRKFWEIQESELLKITHSKGCAEENFQSLSALHLTDFLLPEMAFKHIETYLKINLDTRNRE